MSRSEAIAEKRGCKAAQRHAMTCCMLAILLLLGGGMRAYSQAQSGDANKNPVTVAPDGTVSVQEEVIPISNLLSPEAKAYMVEHLKAMQTPAISRQENGIPIYMKPYLEQARAMFPVDQQDTKIAGVHVYVFTPKEGIAAGNSHRVLINLHGGGFSGCWPGCALLESIPIAGAGKYKVITVDYREGPEYKFPAASEDVATVYSELLKEYKPQDIGIYGCSAGGMLTSMSMAWFEKHDLPMPGAIGIFCAGGGGVADGDSMYLSMPAGEARTPQSFMGMVPRGYLEGTDPNDPLVQQANHLDILAKFPPTLIISGTRDMALSNALYTNEQLDKAGVETKLMVWEGLFHGFFYNPGIPESQHAYRVITGFFDKKLGK
jgi:acetyl esterase/lipase